MGSIAMNKLTEMLSIRLPSDRLIATQPAWTYADWQQAVLGWAQCLQQQQVQTVAVWCEDVAYFAGALLAAWQAGAKVLLPPNLAQDNIEWGNTAERWLTDITLPSRVHPPTVWHLPSLLPNLPTSTQLVAPDVIAPQAEVYLKTSGSTGGAQIVMKTAAQMEAEALALAAVLPFAQPDVAVVGSVSLQHLYGLTFRFAVPLTMGWTLDRLQNAYPETLLAATLPYSQAVWIASPAVLNRLGEGRDWQAVQGKLVGIVSAGGVLPDDTADLLAQHAVRPFEIYGSTETGVIAARQGSQTWQALAAVQVGQNTAGALWAQSAWTTGRVQTADMIEPQGAGFLLLGRQDRIIKFEDKRVSLQQIEQDLLKHEWVADAYCGQHPHYQRPAVWVALKQEGIVALQNQGRAALASILKKHLAITQDPVALPRYWRFTDVLPRNDQSKITAEAFQQALTHDQTTVDWQIEETPDTAIHRFTGRVPLDLVYFAGHFAHFPLVPGVIELQWVRELAARFTWGQRTIIRVENLKYQQFVRPHDRISIELQYDADKDKLGFKITHDEAVCASGRMVFGTFSSAAKSV